MLELNLVKFQGRTEELFLISRILELYGEDRRLNN
jgi:hypothetical protein